MYRENESAYEKTKYIVSAYDIKTILNLTSFIKACLLLTLLLSTLAAFRLALPKASYACRHL